MRVLLFSPLIGRDRAGGDTSYTEALLAEPPNGVTYTTYGEALDDGSMVLRGRRPRHGETNSDLGLFCLRVGETALRRAKLMFAEQLWFATIDPDAFDLVHLHLFSLRQVVSHVPVVSSAGYPLPVLYHQAKGWSARRTSVALALEDRLARRTGASVPWLRPARSDLMTAYSGHFRDWLVERHVPERQVRVMGTALPALPPATRHTDGRTLAFVAKDYQRKGGDIAVAAFEQMRHTDPTLSLLVATETPAAVRSLAGIPGVEIFDNPARSVVLQEILPRTDVLLAPTRLDCGAPYGLLEALQRGCGIVTTTVPWLDERLGGPAVRRVPLSVDAVSEAAADLLAGDRTRLAEEAHHLWATTFSMQQLHADLLSAYRHAIAATDG
ncbi:MAG: glycosyltransferase [Acidimicrobiales bacterium]|jgi:glycosyltransferase involved in cell wall biosynthesis